MTNYQNRFKPDKHRAKNIVLQQRDIEILSTVFQEGLLSTEQIAKLLFPSYQGATRRLQKLWNAGLLTRNYLPIVTGSSPAVYTPCRQGIKLLLQQGVIKAGDLEGKIRKFNIASLKHELETNEFKITLQKACNGKAEIFFCDKGSQYWDSVTIKQLNSTAQKYPIRPDRFLFIKFKNSSRGLSFFVEIDRGTMSLKLIKEKIMAYRSYYFNEGFFKKYGRPEYRKEDYPFRVLFTTTTRLRRNNMTEQAVKVGSHEMMWFTVFDEFITNPLGNIWATGANYLQALKPFENGNPTPSQKSVILDRHMQLKTLLPDI